MKRGMAVIVGLLAGTLLVSCATHHRHAAPPPEPAPLWTQNPKPNDSVNLYRIGTAVGEPSSLAAREAAYRDALRQITQSVMVEVLGAAAGATPPALPLSGAEIVPGGVYTVRTFFGYDAWVQVSFPLTEKRKLVDSLRK